MKSRFRGPTHTLIAKASCAALVLATTKASSQSQGSAQALFDEGRSAMKAGDPGRACANFAESQRLDPGAGTLLNLAICEEQLGHLAAAFADYGGVEGMLPPDDPRVAIARRGRQGLETRVPRLKLVADPDREVSEIVLDDAPQPMSIVGTWIPVDPGIHRVAIVGSDGRRGETDVRIGVGQRFELALAPIIAEDAAKPRTTARERAPAETSPHTVRPPARSALRPATYVAGGLAAVGFVSAGVLTVVALTEKGTVDGHCEGKVCDRSGTQAASNGARLLRLADVGLVIGGVGAGAAGFLLWEMGHEKVRVSPASGGAVVTFSTAFR